MAVCAALLCGPSGMAWAGSFMISPNKFEFPLNRRYTNFFTVTNNSDQVTSMRIYVQAVGLNDADQVIEKKGGVGDMTDWVVINPRRVTLGPQEKRIVRFSVRAPEKMDQGEYNTFIFFEELPPPPEPAPSDAGSKDGGAIQGASVQLNLLTRVGAGLWAQVGAPEYKIALEPGTASWAGEKLEYSGAVVNEGNAHVTLLLQAALLDRDGHSQQEWKSNFVLFRGDKRHLQVDWKRPPPGDYTLQLAVSGEQVPAVEAKVAFAVGPLKGK